MYNDKIEQIKILLKDFSEVKETTRRSEDNLYKIKYSENPINANLMSFCFDNILGFKVKYRIFEKVNYIIEFDYKGTYGCIGHYKLSYEFNIEKNLKDEVLQLFMRVKALLEEAFLEMAIDSMEDNKFTMENEFIYFSEKFNFYRDRIKELDLKIKISFKERDKIVEEIGIFTTKGCETYNGYGELLRNMHYEMLYSMESYIDVFYSFLEHILTLLCPFTESFDLSKSYNSYINNPNWTWNKKILTIFDSRQDVLELIEPLRKIKEIYRNRNAHGMFSRELKVYVNIKNFGNYPLYIGKNYLKGFIDDNETKLDFSTFNECKDVFEEFFAKLDKYYHLPMMFIKSGIPIPVDVSNLISNIETEEDVELKINKIDYELSNQYNMDW
ncbi:hypothetical protein Cpap_0064 [Ruminiclostridium papyrosolvens DSM 2782]|uniref:Uncharacterized protein n=1 Tax=Ruminiclostridium papyrosolvens DSM 2782 TaxID=588581 RepID=F1TIN8_9FIRM|nr:hypothetical protein [Ruminiclostridium papyrosolvens]EGD45737.1 hypothetical protein Cpap_0064 [Ruminiclostridium papyrosolvens DSM 2782]WES35323.1 hypothetical protein P0092_04925 [Ruminiclostridium papyrosolvens DSM 2782]